MKKVDFIVYSVNPIECEKFFECYPKFKTFMLKFPINSKIGILKSYIKFINAKNKLTSSEYHAMGFKSHILNSPTFGAKIFIDENWFGVKGHYAELYQYLHKK